MSPHILCAMQYVRDYSSGNGPLRHPMQSDIVVLSGAEDSGMNDRIVIDPEIQHGKPVIRGTRLPVARIVGGLAGGMTTEEIIREYEITEEDVRAALRYAAELIEAEIFHPLP